ncbi:MAG: V4R domain-containing protein [Candidatus Freyarchaeum deiterrae]
MGVKGTLAWRIKAEKINVMIVRAVLIAVAAKLIKIYGDPAVANQEGKNIGRSMGEFIFTQYLSGTQKPAKSIEELADPKSAYNLGFKFFTGVTFDKIELKKNVNDVYITYTIADCPLCRGLVSPSPQVFLCNVMAGIFEWIEEQRLNEWNAESIKCDEVKCRARGDPVCQFVFHFRLKEQEFFGEKESKFFE